MHSLKNDHLQINFLPNGSIEKIISDGIMINQVDGNLIDGSLANIYLRNSENGKYRDTKLIGPESNSEFSLTEHAAKWSGEFDGISYIVTLYLGDQKWFWNIDLTSDSDNSKQTDIFYTQDLGLGLPSFVSSNEAYASQYIDHHIEKKSWKNFNFFTAKSKSGWPIPIFTARGIQPATVLRNRWFSILWEKL